MSGKNKPKHTLIGFIDASKIDKSKINSIKTISDIQ